jgi:hypothetical protein
MTNNHCYTCHTDHNGWHSCTGYPSPCGVLCSTQRKNYALPDNGLSPQYWAEKDATIAHLRSQLSAAQERAEKAEAILRDMRDWLSKDTPTSIGFFGCLEKRIDAHLKKQGQG